MSTLSPDSSYSMTSYIRKQATVAAIFNVVLNPLLAWLINRGTDFIPLWASNGIVVDLALTAVILSVLVAYFMARGLRQDLGAGHITTGGESPHVGRLLARLPSRGTTLGLLIGVGVAIVVILVCWLLHALGASGLSLATYIVFKAAYGGVLGYVVARWVILRLLLDTSSAR